MTIQVAQVDIATDRWSDLISKLNTALAAFVDVAVTVNGGAAVGVARVAGTISANTVHAATLNGGTVETPADLRIGSTVTFSANTAFQGANNSFGNISSIHTLGSNASHKTVMANNVTGKFIYVSLLDEIKLIDGAGSGVDADLLDGEDSTYYTNIVARLGYTPVNKVGDTLTGTFNVNANCVFSAVSNIRATGANASHKTLMANTTSGAFRYASLLDEIKLIAGAGSGVDADLLDGQEGSYYSAINDRLGYTAANKAGDTFTGNVIVNGELTSKGLHKVENGISFGTTATMNYSGSELVLNLTDSIKMTNATVAAGRSAVAANTPVLLFTVNTTAFKGGKISSQYQVGANTHTSELLYALSGTQAYVSEYAIIAPSGELVTYSANTAGSNLRVYATAQGAGTITYQVTHLRG